MGDNLCSLIVVRFCGRLVRMAVLAGRSVKCVSTPVPGKLSLGRRVGEVHERGGTIVLTRCCRANSVRSVTSFIKSDLTLTRRTTGAATSVVIFYNIRFVNRATGILYPSGGILIPSLGTNYSLTSDYPTISFTRFIGRRPNRIIVSCMGAATTMGTIASIIMASAGTHRVIRDFPRSAGVVFNPSQGLNGCVGNVAKHGVLL